MSLKRIAGGWVCALAATLCAGASPASADVSAIAFERTGGQLQSGIWAIPASGGAPGLLIESASSPSFSPDSNDIAYVGGDPFGIRVANINGSGDHVVRELTPEAFLDFGPNGRVVFTESKPTEQSPVAKQIRTVNADGSGLETVYEPSSDGHNTIGSPAFSPDGTRIVFWQIAFSGPFEVFVGIFIVNSDGSGLTQLTADGSDPQPEFSPDGTKIVFSRHGDIYEMNADGSGVSSLTASAEVTESAPTYSPDGSQIAFAATKEGESDIEVMNADGSGRHKVTASLGGEIANPTWANLASLPINQGGKRFSRSISIAYSRKRDQFRGRIRSSHARCERGRVRVYRIEKGRDQRVTLDSANRVGRWLAEEDPKDGKYYARTSRRTIQAGVCPAVRSKTIEIG